MIICSIHNHFSFLHAHGSLLWHWGRASRWHHFLCVTSCKSLDILIDFNFICSIIMAAAPVPQFITKLYKLANAPQALTYVCWSEDGENFWVSNIESFSRDVLPVYFKHNNYASFVRQLNMYGMCTRGLSSVIFQGFIVALSQRGRWSLEWLWSSALATQCFCVAVKISLEIFFARPQLPPSEWRRKKLILSRSFLHPPCHRRGRGKFASPCPIWGIQSAVLRAKFVPEICWLLWCYCFSFPCFPVSSLFVENSGSIVFFIWNASESRCWQ